MSQVHKYVRDLGNRNNPKLLNHVLDVYEQAERLCSVHKPTYPRVVKLSALIHDIGKLNKHFRDHEIYAANWAIDHLPKYGCSEYETKMVALICKRHDQVYCSNPSTEELLLRTADAASHLYLFFYSDLYFELVKTMPKEKAKEKILVKLNIDFHHKLSFSEEKKIFQGSVPQNNKIFLD